MTDPAFVPHLDALARCGLAGFHFMPIPDAIYGFRDRRGAMDVLLVRYTTDARAARFRSDDLWAHTPPVAMWTRSGTVADVVAELLALPAHGEPGAPRLAHVGSDLWLPLAGS